MEPFCGRKKLEKFRRGLGFDFAYANCNNKIWFFGDSSINCIVIEDLPQLINCSIDNNGETLYMTLVYAKCKAHLREPLWDSIKSFSNGVSSPWMVIGDFNAITDPQEKKRGKIHNMSKSLPFINCIVDSGLLDLGYTGSPFTWCNGWAPTKRIWARLDRALVNSEWLQNFADISITHLVRTGSDHAPLLVSTSNPQLEPKKYFRFLDLWTEQEGLCK
ncbi:PREDICTED: uncharacterized protein LOC109222755 [Nicotiana attenuata]|uniref:uncharacterized protein LOC109222755 n=1 Tax=Nicotiana attenuata TaxID=49451 RepID=UPI000904F86E|nr:PREDICTED: uncharacterized protein LOC109222755 [Nicotiana attenuata]